MSKRKSRRTTVTMTGPATIRGERCEAGQRVAVSPAAEAFLSERGLLDPVKNSKRQASTTDAGGPGKDSE